MENSNGFKFKRGDMWWWHDPIYQSKSNNLQVVKGEGTIRHDRPVIIIQNHLLNENETLLVIPCSSTTKHKCDIAITDPEVQKLYNVTYLRCNKMMPIQINQLYKYVMSLNDETMNHIEQKMAKLLFPNLKYDWHKDEKIYMDEQNIRHIKSTWCSKVKLHSNDIIDEIPNSKWNIDKIKQFCHDYVSMPLYEVSEKYEIAEITCTKLFVNWRDFCNDPIVSNYNKSKKWTVEEKIAFVKFYYDKGCDATAKEYYLAKSTIKSYISKFKEKHPKLEKIDDVKINVLPFPDVKNAAGNVFWLANIMAKTCKAFDMFHSIYLNYKIKSSEYLTMEGFYTILRNSINSGILSALNIIKLSDDNLYTPEILNNDKYINTWKFLDICNDNIIPPTSSDGVNLVKECHRLYGTKISLHVDVINEIRKYLKLSINIAPAGLNLFQKMMLNIYCDPDEVKKIK